jgi:hypothetical protein
MESLKYKSPKDIEELLKNLKISYKLYEHGQADTME